MSFLGPFNAIQLITGHDRWNFFLRSAVAVVPNFTARLGVPKRRLTAGCRFSRYPDQLEVCPLLAAYVVAESNPSTQFLICVGGDAGIVYREDDGYESFTYAHFPAEEELSPEAREVLSAHRHMKSVVYLTDDAGHLVESRVAANGEAAVDLAHRFLSRNPHLSARIFDFNLGCELGMGFGPTGTLDFWQSGPTPSIYSVAVR